MPLTDRTDTPMSRIDQESCRQALLRLRDRLDGDVSALAEEVFRAAGGEASGGLSNVPIHLADLGTAHFEQTVAVSLLVSEERTLEEVAAALVRIEKGTFGRCEGCQQEIAGARL